MSKGNPWERSDGNSKQRKDSWKGQRGEQSTRQLPPYTLSVGDYILQEKARRKFQALTLQLLQTGSPNYRRISLVLLQKGNLQGSPRVQSPRSELLWPSLSWRTASSPFISRRPWSQSKATLQGREQTPLHSELHLNAAGVPGTNTRLIVICSAGPRGFHLPCGAWHQHQPTHELGR